MNASLCSALFVRNRQESEEIKSILVQVPDWNAAPGVLWAQQRLLQKMKPTRGFRKNYKNKLQKHNLWDLANKIGLSALAKCSLRGGCARAASALVAAGRPPRSVHVHPLAPTPLKPLEAMSHLLKVFVCLFFPLWFVFSSVCLFFPRACRCACPWWNQIFGLNGKKK